MTLHSYLMGKKSISFNGYCIWQKQGIKCAKTNLTTSSTVNGVPPLSICNSTFWSTLSSNNVSIFRNCVITCTKDFDISKTTHASNISAFQHKNYGSNSTIKKSAWISYGKLKRVMSKKGCSVLSWTLLSKQMQKTKAIPQNLKIKYSASINFTN